MSLLSSSSRTSPRPSGRPAPSTPSRSRSSRARSSASPARTGRASPRSSRSCAASTPRTPGASLLDGKPHHPRDPEEAEKAGIAVFHQEIPVCPNLSIAANVFLGPSMPRRGIGPDWKRMNARCVELYRGLLGEDIDPERLVKDCTAAEKQLALLVRVLSRDARLGDPGRADHGAHPSRGRAALRHHPAARGPGDHLPLHQPHARGARAAVRHHLRPAGREERRHASEGASSSCSGSRS